MNETAESGCKCDSPLEVIRKEFPIQIPSGTVTDQGARSLGTNGALVDVLDKLVSVILLCDEQISSVMQ